MQGSRMVSDNRKIPPYNQAPAPRRLMKEMGPRMKDRGRGGGIAQFGKVDTPHGPGGFANKRPMNFSGRNTAGSFRKRLTRGGAFAGRKKAVIDKVQMSRKARASEGIAGFIFGCTNRTENECLQRQLFGLPGGNVQDVKMIAPGTPLFLFNYEDRVMTGVYTAASQGASNIVPEAWGGEFPAQVRMNIPPMKRRVSEKVFKPILEENYFKGNRFIYQLNETQVSCLCKIFKQPVPKPLVSMNNNHQKDAQSTEPQYNLPYKQSMVMNPTTVAPTGGKLFGGIRGVTITPDSVKAPVNSQWVFTGTDEGQRGLKTSIPARSVPVHHPDQIVFGAPPPHSRENLATSPAPGRRQENAPHHSQLENFQGTFQQAPRHITFGASHAFNTRNDASKSPRHEQGSMSLRQHGVGEKAFQQSRQFGFGSNVQGGANKTHKRPEASEGGGLHGPGMFPNQGTLTNRFEQNVQNTIDQRTSHPKQAQPFGWMGVPEDSHPPPTRDIVFGSQQHFTGNQQEARESMPIASPVSPPKPSFHMHPVTGADSGVGIQPADLRNYIKSRPSQQKPKQDTETKTSLLLRQRESAIDRISKKPFQTSSPVQEKEQICFNRKEHEPPADHPIATNFQGSWGFLQPDGSYGLLEHESEPAPSSGSQAESDGSDGHCKAETRKRYPSLEYTPKPGSEFETLLAGVDDLDTAFGRTQWETDEMEFLVETLYESYAGKKRKAGELSYSDHEVEEYEYIDDMPVITAHHIKRRGIGNHSALWSVRCEGGIVGVHGRILPRKQELSLDTDMPEAHCSERSTHFAKVASGFYSDGSSPEEIYKNLVHNRLSFFWRPSATKAWSAMKEMRKAAIAEKRVHLFDEVMEESGYVREHGLEPVCSGQTALF